MGVANRIARVFCCAYLGIKLLNHVGVVQTAAPTNRLSNSICALVASTRSL